MSKIVRYEFMGSWLLFWLYCVTVIGNSLRRPVSLACSRMARIQEVLTA